MAHVGHHPHGHPTYGDEATLSVAVDRCVEIGAGVCIRPCLHWRPDQGETETDARIVGYVVAHEVSPGEEARCEGACMTELGFGPTEVWTATGSIEGGDLTLLPSVQCKTHPEFHAFVTNGRWTR